MPEVRDMAEERLRQIITQTCAAFGATAEITYLRDYPVTSNHPQETVFAAEAARAVSGDCDTNAPVTMGGEDFAYMLEERPGAYILMGNGDTAKVHQPDYDFNDDAIPAGCSYWVELAEQRLPLPA